MICLRDDVLPTRHYHEVGQGNPLNFLYDKIFHSKWKCELDKGVNQ